MARRRRRRTRKNPGDLLTIAVLGLGGYFVWKWMESKKHEDIAAHQLLLATSEPPEVAPEVKAAVYNNAMGMTGFSGFGNIGRLEIGY